MTITEGTYEINSTPDEDRSKGAEVDPERWMQRTLIPLNVEQKKLWEEAEHFRKLRKKAKGAMFKVYDVEYKRACERFFSHL